MPQLLELAKSDGEDVGEDRLVDTSQERGQAVLTLGHTVAAGNGYLSYQARIIDLGAASDLVAAARPGHAHCSAGFATEDRGQVPLTTFRV